MIAGFIIVNFAKHHNRSFHEIEHIEWPFMVFFFVLAGASLQIAGIVDIGMVGLGYINASHSGASCWRLARLPMGRHRPQT